MLVELDLDRDVTTGAVVSHTNYQISSATAASERNINAFVAEATSTGFLVSAKGTTTTTPLSSAFRAISNYYFSLVIVQKFYIRQSVFKILISIVRLHNVKVGLFDFFAFFKF